MNSTQWIEKISNWEDVNFDDIYKIVEDLKELEKENDLLTSAFMLAESIDKNGDLKGSIIRLQKRIEELEQESGVWRNKYHHLATGEYVKKLEEQLDLVKKMYRLDDWNWDGEL